MMGFTNAGGGGAIDVSWSGSTVAAANPGATAIASVTFETNGDLNYSTTATDNLSTLSPTAGWFTPNSTGIGSSYWMRVTASGVGVTSGTVGSFVSLASAQTWTRNAGATLIRTTTLTIDFSSSATGTPIVASATLTLDADGS